MRDRVLAAVPDASPRVLVGPVADPPPGVLTIREEPPGAGPVAALAAGLTLVGAADLVAVLAADLPLLTPYAVGDLADLLLGSASDGAVYLDDTGRRQPLCGVWRAVGLRRGLDRLAGDRGGSLVGASMRSLLVVLAVAELPWRGTGPPPWFDCDTADDIRRAEEWTR